MNNTDDMIQLNEMLKRVEKLVSNLPETEQMIYQTMIKAKPDSLEHLKTIEQIAKDNIADAATDYDYDDYIPETFSTPAATKEDSKAEVEVTPSLPEPKKPTPTPVEEAEQPIAEPLSSPVLQRQEEPEPPQQKNVDFGGLSGLKQLSEKLKTLGSKKPNSKASSVMPDKESFEAYEKEFNEFDGTGHSMESSFGISRMMDRKKAEAIFGMDIVNIKEHPSSNQRYFRLMDGSVAKETLDSFQIKTHDIRKNIDTIVAVAKEKGWKKIELNGGRAYLEQMYLAARKEGLHVKPTDETQKFLFEQLDKRFKLNEQKTQNNEDNSISVKNADEDFEVKNSAKKKNSL